ncbi:hypothetical protein L486_05621 [Kwoniella mangroviensis CBS 10435]|uniref:Uncharacterized protein n=1 Tax=Kwoniella mangroviensis CBS 10435 TaxID=1331196 RepID=A0A1B9IME4_9TREE|nr:uncharacterized protein I203_07269 [Kwoniella mangroviensis CBS 8507]OCF56766.1 hypothetical protein L486_05621 [Kwoniella mangroviensis CBS 10435]OCF63571.1 hypothetical protein I203_07269 [Kwoniella mangroviensis CBS 8507]OCF75338.1 hypothetical protein I204_04193 [Kwoniella mangroviensis CBS 8886]
MNSPFRTLLSFSQPLRSSSRLSIHSTSSLPRRALMTFPHPTLEDPSSGSTKLIIKSFNRNFPSLIQIYTVLKQVEKKLNIEIFDFSILKDHDSLSPLNTIFLTTLKPIQLESPILMEIPLGSKNISGESNFLGGPSLKDIQNALNTTTQTHSPLHQDTENISTTSNQIKKGGDGEDGDVLQIKIELQRKPLKSKSERKNQTRHKRARHSLTGKEASDIVQQLKAFNGGFYGGFEGLAEKFDHLIIRAEEEQPQQVEQIGGQAVGGGLNDESNGQKNTSN